MPRKGDGRALATVLFTDIVGSTELAAELGDQHWKKVLATHHGVVRRALKRFGGREIDTAGDGFFATFSRPADAVRCAAEIIDQLRLIGIQIRAGVHMGEVERMGKVGTLGGIAVHIGARVAAKAGPSEILVSSTVRDLVAGSDIRFSDRGPHDLKGVPGRWTLYAIDRELAGPVPERPLVDAPQAKAARRRTVPVTALVAVIVVAATMITIFAVRGKGPNVVAVPGPSTISRIDTKTSRFVGTARAGTKPTAAVAGGGSLWVIDVSDQTLSRVDPSTGAVASSRAVGGPPTGVAFGAGSVWVTTQFGLTNGATGSVLRFDPDAPGVSKVIAVGNGVAGITFGGNNLWVTNTIHNTVSSIDPDTSSVTRTIQVGNGPQAVAASADAVWVANTLDDSVWKIDVRTGAVSSKIKLATSPSSLAIDGTTLWVASQSGNTVTRIDTTSGTTVATIAVGAQPAAIAAGHNGVWVCDDAGHDVERIDPATNRVAKRLPVRGSPEGIAILGGVVWVTVHA